MTYPMTIAGLRRELPLCKVADDFYIGAFTMFGDAEITVACAKAPEALSRRSPWPARKRFWRARRRSMTIC